MPVLSMPRQFTGLARRAWNRLSRMVRKPIPQSAKHWIPKIVTAPQGQVVQIGSNDGMSNDPLHELLLQRELWRALLVEPVPYLFDRLKTNYPDSSRFAFANLAIGEPGPREFFWVDSSAKSELTDLPYWFDQLGSFDRKHITKHLDGRLEPYIRSTTIQAVSLSQLLDQFAVKQVTLLHIDAEGYDYEILKQLDLRRWQPDLILFEHMHLPAADKARAHQMLAELYDLHGLGGDTLAVRRGAATVDARPLRRFLMVPRTVELTAGSSR